MSEDITEEWKKWLSTFSTLEDYAITRNYLVERIETMSDVTYLLHGFCDASDSAFSCVVYLRGVHDERSHVNFVIGKSKVILTHQKGWVIARKELEAAELLIRLMHSTSKAIQNLNCTAHYWTDSQVAQMAEWYGASVSRAVDSGLIPSRVKPMTLKNGIHSFPA